MQDAGKPENAEGTQCGKESGKRCAGIADSRIFWKDKTENSITIWEAD